VKGERALVRLIYFIALLVFSCGASANASALFWIRITEQTLKCSDRDGANAQTILNNVANAMSLTADPSRGKLYWADRSWGIRRANLDGTEQELVVAIENMSDTHIAIDPNHGKLFWLRETQQTIFSSNLDGSGTATILTGVANSMGLQVDPLHDRLYWADRSWGIRSANLDGSGQKLIIPIENMSETNVALDAESDSLFFLRQTQQTIYKSDLIGNNIEPVLSNVNNAMSLSLDLIHDRLYWADRSWGIRSVNDDGSDEQLIISIENMSDTYVALVPEPTGVSLVVLAGVFAITRRGVIFPRKHP
jgi:hypothetical protein